MRDAALLVLQVLYLFAPLVASSAAAAIVLRLDLFPALRRPLDGGAKLGGKRVFGDNKTWRGVAVAVVGCVATAAVQRYVVGDRAGRVALFDYRTLDVFLFGLAMGGGAMLGELPNSFAKRRIDVPPGGSARGFAAAVFYVWDQVDLLTTSWPLISFWVRPTLPLVATSFAVVLAAHPAVSLVGYLVGARRTAR